MAQQTKLNTLALVSLVLAIVALPAVACAGCGAVALGIAAIVIGLMARRRIAASGGMETGSGLAIAGVIIGALAALLGLLFGLVMLQILGMALHDPDLQRLFENYTRQLGVQ